MPIIQKHPTIQLKPTMINFNEGESKIPNLNQITEQHNYLR